MIDDAAIFDRDLVFSFCCYRNNNNKEGSVTRFCDNGGAYIRLHYSLVENFLVFTLIQDLPRAMKNTEECILTIFA